MKFQKNPQFFSKVFDDKWVLLKQDSDYCYKLSKTAGFLWEKLKEPKSLENLLKAIIQTYGVNKETAKKDLEIFLKNGVKNGFLVSKT
jgi:hypothetical protein